MADRGRLRASHADREQVIDILKTALADGRLDKDELDARVSQTLAARTYAELAAATAGIPAAPAQAPPCRAARPVNKEAVRWGLAAAGAMIPPAMFVTALYGAPTLVPLAALAFLLLVIELPVVITFAAITLTKQYNDRSRASGGHLPPLPGQAGRAVEAERHRSAGPGPASPGLAPARPARTCGSAGPGGTGRAVADRVSRCCAVPRPRRVRPRRTGRPGRRPTGRPGRAGGPGSGSTPAPALRPWTGSWTGAPDNPSVVSAVSAMIRVNLCR